MIVHLLMGPARILVVALALLSPSTASWAQSANAIALAKEIITIKGSAAGFVVVVPRIIEQAKSVLLQTNPMLTKDLNEVALKLRTEYTARSAQPLNDAAKLYASKFTEQELKDTLAFYKSPAGKKVIEQEPQIFEQSMNNLDEWASKLSEEVLGRFRAEMRKKGHEL